MRKIFAVFLATLLLSVCSVVGAAKQEASPEWVTKLPQAKDAKQLFVVAAVSDTTAWISMHEKDADGNWRVLMTTPGFIGKEGIGETREGISRTPVGVYRFNAAFGIAPDPGCAIPYTQVNEDLYWSSDDRPGMRYNQMVDIHDVPGLDTEISEHLIEIYPHYIYALNISYNPQGIPGIGSAFFLHCLGSCKPYTGGCVAIPEADMRFVMQHVRPDCVVVLDLLKCLSPDTAEKWGI